MQRPARRYPRPASLRELGVSRIVDGRRVRAAGRRGVHRLRARSRVARGLWPRFASRIGRAPGIIQPVCRFSRRLCGAGTRTDAPCLDERCTARTAVPPSTSGTERSNPRSARSAPGLDRRRARGATPGSTSSRLGRPRRSCARRFAGIFGGIVASMLRPATTFYIVTGSQQALDLVVRALCEEGTPSRHRGSTLSRARRRFLAIGARGWFRAPSTTGRSTSRDMRSVCTDVRALYVHAVASVSHRRSHERRTAAQSAGMGGTSAPRGVIEDDYDSEFPLRNRNDSQRCAGSIRAAIASSMSGRSRCTLSPEFAPRLHRRAAGTARYVSRHAKWLADRGSSPIGQRALAAMMASRNSFRERAQRRMARSLGERRRQVLISATALSERGFDEMAASAGPDREPTSSWIFRNSYRTKRNGWSPRVCGTKRVRMYSARVHTISCRRKTRRCWADLHR